MIYIKKRFDFPGGSDSKESSCNAEDLDSIPGLGRCPGEGNGNSLQCSCMRNPMDRGAWWATVQGFAKGRTRLSDLAQESLLDALNGHSDSHFNRALHIN